MDKQKLIYGEFQYKEDFYPFVIDGHIMTVVQQAFHYSSDFSDVEQVAELVGVTSSNQHIMMLGCRCISNERLSLIGRVQFSMLGYIIYNSDGANFDKLVFYSPAINAFYSPMYALNAPKEMPKYVYDIQISLNKNADKYFALVMPAETIQCKLDFDINMNCKLETSEILTIQTRFSMEFSKSKPLKSVEVYYLYMLDFLTFANFERDVPIEHIYLYSSVSEGKAEKNGEAVIFQNDCSAYIPNVWRSINHSDIGDENFPGLFKEVVLRRKPDGYNSYFIPTDRQDSMQLDCAKWLVAAISFEGEFNRNYSDYKYETDANFKRSKDMLLSTIDKSIIESGKGANNKVNDSLTRFRKLIDSNDTTIEEKFRFCEEHFSHEIADVIKKFCTNAKVDSTEEIKWAKEYSDTRNKTAHGTITLITAKDVVTYKMLLSFTYLLIMERAKLPEDRRKAIIEKLF